MSKAKKVVDAIADRMFNEGSGCNVVDTKIMLEEITKAYGDTEEETGGEEASMEEFGWKPVAVTEECLKPSEDELMVVVAYEKLVEGVSVYATKMECFSPTELKTYIEKNSLEIIKETAFNKRFNKRG